MPATTKGRKATASPNGRAKAEAAQKEKRSEKREIEIAGQKFALPPDMPFQIMLCARLASRAEREGDEMLAAEATMDMAVAYIGEEGLRTLTKGCSAEEGMERVRDLLETANNEYGASTGESSASQDS